MIEFSVSAIQYNSIEAHIATSSYHGTRTAIEWVLYFIFIDPNYLIEPGLIFHFFKFLILWLCTGSCPNLPQGICRRYVFEVSQFWEYFYIILVGYKTTWSKYISTKNAIAATLSYDMFNIMENSKANIFKR